MLLILLIAVPVGIGLAVLLERLENRGESVETWIEDAHPLFARPSDVVAAGVVVGRKSQLRLTAPQGKASRPGTTRAKPPEHRRAA